MGERPTTDAPNPGRRRPPRAPSCRPYSAQSQLARARAVGLVTSPHARTSAHPQPVGSGRRGPPRGRAVGVGRAPDPGCPTPRQEARPPGTLMPPPQHARARAVGLLTGLHARTPPHPQPVGSGPRQPAQRAGSRGWQSARPRTPHTQAGGAPPRRPRAAPTARKASSQERAVGLVMGPHARTPAHPQPVGSWPRQPAQRAGSRRWESARPWTPHTQAGGAPPGRPCAAPTARKALSQERALWGW